MCVKSLAKIPNIITPNFLPHIKELTSELVKKSFLNTLKQGPVIAAALICLVELFTCLGAHAVIYVKPFITWVLDLMSESKFKTLNSIVLNSLVVSVQRTMDNFGGFLNPFYPKLIIAACEITAWHQNQDGTLENMEYRQSSHRIKQFQMALSRGISTHTLIAISKSCFDNIKKNPYAVIALANIVKENIGELDKTDVLASSTPLLDFFMHVFKFRYVLNGILKLNMRTNTQKNRKNFSVFTINTSLILFKYIERTLMTKLMFISLKKLWAKPL